MLLKTLDHIPFIQCLTSFSYNAHKVAFKKFITLWILSSFPILFAAVLSPIPSGNLDILQKLTLKLSEAISVSEQFVYTASFITPILYIIFEKYYSSSGDAPQESFYKTIKTVFKGYGLVALVALIVILLTASAFSSLKTNPDSFRLSFLNLFLVTYSPYIYLFSLYCWYLSLLDGVNIGDFVEQNRISENNLSSAFSARIKHRG
jgi:hypothetical protein